MNHTTDNTTSLRCGFAFLPVNPGKSSPDLYAVFLFRIAVNALTCPLIILLNILVMVAVKTKRQLRTKSNVALACLATTDLVVGLVVQPLQIASDSLLLKSQENSFCTLTKVSITTSNVCLMASFNHLLLMSAERYLAIKHTFAHENQVTEVRIIIASGLAWAAAIIFPHFATRLAVFVVLPLILFFPAMIYFNVAVYNEVRRNEKQIAANQVTLEAKEKILKNKKAFYTTTIVLLVIFLCYFPTNICAVILISIKDRIPSNVGLIVWSLVTLLPILNSLFNPVIYAVRIRYFRVAFIQLLARKTIAQAEELERKIFGPRQFGVIANVEQGENRASREEDEQQGNETLDNGHETRVRTQPQKEYEETPL
ncbi:adenosine receptor A3-like [Oculina patagonica]